MLGITLTQVYIEKEPVDRKKYKITVWRGEKSISWCLVLQLGHAGREAVIVKEEACPALEQREGCS